MSCEVRHFRNLDMIRIAEMLICSILQVLKFTYSAYLWFAETCNFSPYLDIIGFGLLNVKSDTKELPSALNSDTTES